MEQERRVTQALYCRMSKATQETTASFEYFETTEYLWKFPNFREMNVVGNIVIKVEADIDKKLTEIIKEARQRTGANIQNQIECSNTAHGVRATEFNSNINNIEINDGTEQLPTNTDLNTNKNWSDKYYQPEVIKNIFKG